MTGIDVLPHMLAAFDAGLCPLPTKQPKHPAVDWKEFQHHRPTRDQLIKWMTEGISGRRPAGFGDGFGILPGPVSGNLEMLEFEGRAVADGLPGAYAARLRDHDLGELWDRIECGYEESTPSGGIHVLFHVTGGDTQRNTDLASRWAHEDELTGREWETVARKAISGGSWWPKRVLIETRGAGGFTVCAPSGGQTHNTIPGGQWQLIAGGFASIATITVAERDALYAIAATFDRMSEPRPGGQPARPVPERPRVAVARDRGGLRPGDDWAAQQTWEQLLTGAGWTHKGGDNWTRPGKDARDGGSATVRADYSNGGGFYLFSTSVPGFEAGRSYSKFAFYAQEYHGGDYAAAARALAEQGFGPPAHTANGHGTGSEIPAIAAPVSGPIEPADDDWFWEARPGTLGQIRLWARHRRAGPYAVLAAVLAELLCHLPPLWQLPPLVGGNASLNMMFAFTGPSGGGKGAAVETARAMWDWGSIGNPAFRISAGSGEGLAKVYGHVEKRRGQPHEFVRDQWAAIIDVADIDTFAALTARHGATLAASMLGFYMGERLGYAYSDPEKRVIIEPHTYRGCFTAGVQPERAGVLLSPEAVGAGMPQRFLWVPTTDRGRPDTKPPAPAYLRWHKPLKITEYETGREHGAPPWRGNRVIEVCPAVHADVDALAVRRLDGDQEKLAGHRMLTREKAALALALLDGRIEIRDDDWGLSDHLMNVSDRTLAYVQAVISAADKARTDARAEREAQVKVVGVKAVMEHAVSDAQRKIRAKLTPEWIAHGELRKKFTSRSPVRSVFREAIDGLVEQGVAEAGGEEGGIIRYRLRPRSDQ